MSTPDDASLQERRRATTHVLLDAGSEQDLDTAEIVPSDATTHHLERVLRLRDGAAVSITDGAGRWRMAVWSGAAQSLQATGPVVTEMETPGLTVASAIPKGDRVDVLVQKVAELGARRVVLLHTEHSVVRWNADRATKQRSRLGRIADEAVRQSRRVHRVIVEGPVDADEILSDAAVAEPGGSPLTGTERCIAIGPEGGWSDRELALASRTVSLGAAVLRVETAAIAACAQLAVLRH